MAQLQVLGLLYWPSAAPRANTAHLGPVTGPIRNYLINNIILLSKRNVESLILIDMQITNLVVCDTYKGMLYKQIKPHLVGEHAFPLTGVFCEAANVAVGWKPV